MDLLLKAALGDYESNGRSPPEDFVSSPTRFSRKTQRPLVERETPTRNKRPRKIFNSPQLSHSPIPRVENDRSNDQDEKLHPDLLRTDSECEFPQTKPLLDYLSSASRLWPTYEWFYSTIDRDYFNENEFKGCLHILDISHVNQLTRTEWSIVRGIMGNSIGRPRRFSRSFLLSEREKLYNYRATCRSIQQDVDNPVAKEFPYQVYAPLSVGDVVTAYNYKTGLLQRGQILTTNQIQADNITYRIQFSNSHYASQIIPDKFIAMHGTPELLLSRRRPGDSEELNEPEVDLETDVDVEVPPEDTECSSPNMSLFPYFSPCPPGADESSLKLLQAVAVYNHMLNRKQLLLQALQTLNHMTDAVGQSYRALKAYSNATQIMNSNRNPSSKEDVSISTNTAAEAAVTTTIHDVKSSLQAAGMVETIEATLGVSVTPVPVASEQPLLVNTEAAAKTVDVYPFTDEFYSQFVWLTTNIDATDKAIDRVSTILQNTLLMHASSAKKSVAADQLGTGTPMSGGTESDQLGPQTAIPRSTSLNNVSSRITMTQAEIRERESHIMSLWPTYVEQGRDLVRKMVSRDEDLSRHLLDGAVGSTVQHRLGAASSQSPATNNSSTFLQLGSSVIKGDGGEEEDEVKGTDGIGHQLHDQDNNKIDNLQRPRPQQQQQQQQGEPRPTAEGVRTLEALSRYMAALLLIRTMREITVFSSISPVLFSFLSTVLPGASGTESSATAWQEFENITHFLV